jgi:hypothetical protein
MCRSSLNTKFAVAAVYRNLTTLQEVYLLFSCVREARLHKLRQVICSAELFTELFKAEWITDWPFEYGILSRPAANSLAAPYSDQIWVMAKAWTRRTTCLYLLSATEQAWHCAAGSWAETVNCVVRTLTYVQVSPYHKQSFLVHELHHVPK